MGHQACSTAGHVCDMFVPAVCCISAPRYFVLIGAHVLFGVLLLLNSVSALAAAVLKPYARRQA